MPRGQHLRNAQRFALVMQTALQIATGNLDLSKESELILQPGQRGPSAATLSRSRAKLDVLGMYIRRWQWASAGFSESIISLCQGPSCARRCHPNNWKSDFQLLKPNLMLQAMMPRSRARSFL